MEKNGTSWKCGEKSMKHKLDWVAGGDEYGRVYWEVLTDKLTILIKTKCNSTEIKPLYYFHLEDFNGLFVTSLYYDTPDKAKEQAESFLEMVGLL